MKGKSREELSANNSFVKFDYLMMIRFMQVPLAELRTRCVSKGWADTPSIYTQSGISSVQPWQLWSWGQSLLVQRIGTR